jgi:adenylate cyclase
MLHWVIVGMSKTQVAERAGLDPGYVQRLVDTGLLVPATRGFFTEGDVRRARLYQGLERTGLPLQAIREALDAGELSFGWLDRPLYDLIAAVSRRSFRDVATETGIPLELLTVVREVIGFAVADPDDPMREDRPVQASGRSPAVGPRWFQLRALTPESPIYALTENVRSPNRPNPSG